MSFFEHQFPASISVNMTGGPVFKTTVARLPSGRRSTNQDRTYPLHRYHFDTSPELLSAFAEVRAFFYNVAGMFDGFRFKDWTDFECAQADGVCTLVSGSDYQLFKQYTMGARSYSRKIQKPVAGATIYRTRGVDTTDITGSSTLDTTTGIVSVTGHVAGDTYAWAGEFDVPVAFTTDEFDARVLERGDELIIDWGSVEVEEAPV